MNEFKIKDPERNGYYSEIKADDFEYANPIMKMSEIVIQMLSIQFKSILLLSKDNNLLPAIKEIKDPDAILEAMAFWKARKIWEQKLQNIMLQTLPTGIFNILNSTSKKEQIQLLKAVSLTVDQLMLFIFKAWKDFGFTYSMYTSHHSHNGLDEKQMPQFSYKNEKGEIKTVGKTELTEGQIKNAIDHRTVIISRFIDNGTTWHCFFLTYKSWKGEENYKNGQPHMHFISHTWGLTREFVLEQLKSKNYKLPSLPHTDFHTY